eukprot:CAMPEP_0185286162 /NCGR_PEP_ID=MMETSP1363-20130426/2114_1 /TAXON_ID=38817 /ORGANISM="Gephyrocapsa oceanica, Strain RCC1303" /LENGTH=45 /DNA_ID= /DNA_START= /DNA_END= /DNA_ORIENTATION=
MPIISLHLSLKVFSLASNSASAGSPSALATHVPSHAFSSFTAPRQ